MSVEDIIEVLKEIRSKYCRANSRNDKGLSEAIELISKIDKEIFKDNMFLN